MCIRDRDCPAQQGVNLNATTAPTNASSRNSMQKARKQLILAQKYGGRNITRTIRAARGRCFQQQRNRADFHRNNTTTKNHEMFRFFRIPRPAHFIPVQYPTKLPPVQPTPSTKGCSKKPLPANAGQYRLLAYWYCGARVILFAFFHRDVYCTRACVVTTG